MKREEIYLKIKEELTNEMGKEPSVGLIAEKLGLTEFEVVNALDSMHDTISMFEPIYNDGSDTIYLYEQLEDKSDTINVAALLTTSNQAYLKEQPENATTYEKEDKDKDGTFNLGVVITDSEESEEASEESASTEETEENIKTKLVVYGTSNLVDESIYSQVTPYNVSLFIKTIGWMCDSEDSITIASKSISEESLTITDSQVNTWMMVYLILIPVFVVGAGITVVVRRRR